jgi:hypothetical protein
LDPVLDSDGEDGGIATAGTAARDNDEEEAEAAPIITGSVSEADISAVMALPPHMQAS